MKFLTICVFLRIYGVIVWKYLHTLTLVVALIVSKKIVVSRIYTTFTNQQMELLFYIAYNIKKLR